MAEPQRRYVDDVPEHIEARLRAICSILPDAYEEAAWVGVRWRVRKKTFGHVLAVDDTEHGQRLVLVFRVSGDELDVLSQVGHPFFVLGWGRNAMGMVIDEQTDWDEVNELMTESYCLLAPKKLVALLDRP